MHKKIKLLQQLATIIKSDGEIAEIEKDFLRKIARSMGIKYDSMDELLLLKNISPDPGPPPTFEERIYDIYGMALMIGIDGKIKPEELTTIRNIGIEMGLPVEPLNNMMELLFKEKKKVLTEQELMKIFSLNKN